MIYKYEIPVGERIKIDCVSVLSAIEQDGKIVVYVLSHTSCNQPHFFYAVGTGWDSNLVDNMRFLDTVKCGEFVWHVFYRGKAV